MLFDEVNTNCATAIASSAQTATRMISKMAPMNFRVRIDI